MLSARRLTRNWLSHWTQVLESLSLDSLARLNVKMWKYIFSEVSTFFSLSHSLARHIRSVAALRWVVCIQSCRLPPLLLVVSLSYELVKDSPLHLLSSYSLKSTKVLLFLHEKSENFKFNHAKFGTFFSSFFIFSAVYDANSLDQYLQI